MPKTTVSPKRVATSRQKMPEIKDEKQLEERTLNVDRVARVVKGGRRFRFRALVVVGDNNGKVGIGSAKGSDVTLAVTKASAVAKKSMITVPIYNDTLPHETDAKVAGAKLLLIPARSGTGLIAGGVIRSILEISGIKNVLSKSLGSSNKTNIAYATIAALQSLVPQKKWTTYKKPIQSKSAKAKAKGKA